MIKFILVAFFLCISLYYCEQKELQTERTSKRSSSRRKKGGRIRVNRQQMQILRQKLNEEVESIIIESDRYHMWWQGSENDPTNYINFVPETWSAQHVSSNNAIFTYAVIQGAKDQSICSSPHDLILFLGSARRYFTGDIVIALETETLSERVKKILAYYRAIVYLLPKGLCSIDDRKQIFCGSADERVPATVFRYYWYEKWSTYYKLNTTILLTDFRDVFFQANPFEYLKYSLQSEGLLANQAASADADNGTLLVASPVLLAASPYQLYVFQEAAPHMTIDNCRFNRQLFEECYGAHTKQEYGGRIIISSGASMGSRNAILLWSHHITRQLQEAPGRNIESRCYSGGIDHSFITYLIYAQKLVSYLNIMIYGQGTGMMNSVGGLKPDTVDIKNLTISNSFTKSLVDIYSEEDGYIHNWNGEISPIVHQLDHFQAELITKIDEWLMQMMESSSSSSSSVSSGKSSKNPVYLQLVKQGDMSKLADAKRPLDKMWQILASTQCLFDCKDSIQF